VVSFFHLQKPVGGGLCVGKMVDGTLGVECPTIIVNSSKTRIGTLYHAMTQITYDLLNSELRS
jgi:hypothetical protein